MSQHALRGLCWLSPLLLTSCIDFDGQTCSYRYDRASDKLHIFQVYERIFGEGQDGKLTEKETTQLTSLVEGERTFFFSNWIFEYSRESLATRVTELESQISSNEGDKIELLKAERSLYSSLLDSIKVTNGNFYLNGKKELCGYQTVTVSNVSRLIDEANRYVSLAALAAEHEKWTEQVHKFAKEDGKWIALDGNQLTIRFFQSPEDFEKGKMDRAKLLANGKPAFEGVISYDEPFATLTLGKKDADRTDFQIDNLSEGQYNTLVLDYVRDRYEVNGMLNIARVRDKFLAAEKGRPE